MEFLTFGLDNGETSRRTYLLEILDRFWFLEFESSELSRYRHFSPTILPSHSILIRSTINCLLRNYNLSVYIDCSIRIKPDIINIKIRLLDTVWCVYSFDVRTQKESTNLLCVKRTAFESWSRDECSGRCKPGLSTTDFVTTNAVGLFVRLSTGKMTEWRRYDCKPTPGVGTACAVATLGYLTRTGETRRRPTSTSSPSCRSPRQIRLRTPPPSFCPSWLGLRFDCAWVSQELPAPVRARRNGRLVRPSTDRSVPPPSP